MPTTTESIEQMVYRLSDEQRIEAIAAADFGTPVAGLPGEPFVAGEKLVKSEVDEIEALPVSPVRSQFFPDVERVNEAKLAFGGFVKEKEVTLQRENIPDATMIPEFVSEIRRKNIFMKISKRALVETLPDAKDRAAFRAAVDKLHKPEMRTKYNITPLTGGSRALVGAITPTGRERVEEGFAKETALQDVAVLMAIRDRDMGIINSFDEAFGGTLFGNQHAEAVRELSVYFNLRNSR